MRDILANHLSRFSKFLSLITRSKCAPPGRRVLFFFHGHSLAHTIRPIVIAQAIRDRGFLVEFAGTGKFSSLVDLYGFKRYSIDSMAQDRLDQFASHSDYGAYDRYWVERLVEVERKLLRLLLPDVVIGDNRPTLRISSPMEAVPLVMIQAAYTAPGYPTPINLPLGFRTSSGVIEEALAERGLSSEQDHLVLLADDPEFHPSIENLPGNYKFVGPLIDCHEPASSPSREHVDTGQWLRESGATGRRLVYMNLGSTGEGRLGLSSMVEAIVRSGYRVILTTAGRRLARRKSRHVHVCDFYPAHLILSEADVFVGVGGIGAIYHALRAGVPILGCPEHLDQEYNLNRVEALGLGLKVEREDFMDQGFMLEAIDRVASSPGFRSRANAIGVHLAAWDGGEVAASAIVEFLLQRRGERRAPMFSVSLEGFTRQLFRSSPPALSQDVITEMVNSATKRGLPSWPEATGSTVWFDSRNSWNWLYDKEPAFFEADYRANDDRRQFFLSMHKGTVSPRVMSAKVTVSYTLRIAQMCLEKGKQYLLFLPTPIENGQQDNIEIECCSPESMREYELASAGFFYGYPFSLSRHQDGYEQFKYTARVDVRSHTAAMDCSPSPLSQTELQKYTGAPKEVTSRTGYVEHFRESIRLNEAVTHYSKAKRIYCALVTSRRFQKTKETCQCLSCSTSAVLTSDVGHCVTLARSFIALCRAEGIPAREVTGALCGYRVGRARFISRTRSEAIWGHTWAEFFTEERGWIPVEFHGVVIGRHSMTEDNVVDAKLRRQIDLTGDSYLDFYFGSLDCHRIVCSNSVSRIPQIVELSTTGSPPITLQASDYECELCVDFSDAEVPHGDTPSVLSVDAGAVTFS